MLADQLHRALVFVSLLFRIATADVWVPPSMLHSSPARNDADSSPVFKTWASTDFLNPMPAPVDLQTELLVDPDSPWLGMSVTWRSGDANFPELDFAEYQVWRAQDKGSFSFRGFVSFGDHVFLDDKVVYASSYRYKLRLVTEWGMGPFSEVVTMCTGPAPVGYTRPTSTSTPGKRMRELRERILEAARVEALALEASKESDNETDASEPVAGVAQSEKPAQEDAEDGRFIVSAAPSTSTPTSTFSTPGMQSHAEALVAGEEAWAHLTRPDNETAVTAAAAAACSGADEQAGLCTAGADGSSARTWFYQALLSKVLGGAAADLSAAL